MVSVTNHSTRGLAPLLLLAGLSLSAVTLVGAHADAQSPEEARQLFERGVQAMDGGNPGLASQYFQQSYQMFPRASTACNMALSLERTGRACDAEGWYRQCAALDQSGRFRDHANRQAAALSSQCAQSGQPTQSPFVGGAQPVATSNGGAGVQVVEGGTATTRPLAESTTGW